VTEFSESEEEEEEEDEEGEADDDSQDNEESADKKCATIFTSLLLFCYYLFKLFFKFISNQLKVRKQTLRKTSKSQMKTRKNWTNVLRVLTVQ
jgi:hypothetical protein